MKTIDELCIDFRVDIDDIKALLSDKGIENPTPAELAEGILKKALYEVCNELRVNPGGIEAAVVRDADRKWCVWFYMIGQNAYDMEQLETLCKTQIT
jgi:hypothetical protein